VFNLFLPAAAYPARLTHRGFFFFEGFPPQTFAQFSNGNRPRLLTMNRDCLSVPGLVGLPLAVGFVFGAIVSPPTPWQRWRSLKNLRVPRKDSL